MSISISVLRRFPPQRGIRSLLVEITGDTSYPTGGTAIAAATVNLSAITRVLPQNPYPLVNRQYVWDNTNGKLMAQVSSTGAEVANTTACNADKVVALIIGR